MSDDINDIGGELCVLLKKTAVEFLQARLPQADFPTVLALLVCAPIEASAGAWAEYAKPSMQNADDFIEHVSGFIRENSDQFKEQRP